MSKYNEDLDYLIQDVDISKEELEEIIVEADKILSNSNIEQDKFIEAYLKKVQCMQKLGKCIETKEYIDILLDFNPNMPEALVRLGNFYDETKEHGKAVEVISKAIEKEKDYAYAYCMRGLTYDDKVNYEKALQDYSTAIHYKPDYAGAYNNRGNTYNHIFEYEKAIDDFHKAIQISPRYFTAYSGKASALMQLKRDEETISLLNQMIELNSNSVWAWFAKGCVYSDTDKLEEAIDAYDHVVAIDIDYKDAWLFRGNALRKSHKLEEALKSYNHALIIDPYDKESWICKALALGGLMKYEEAIECFDKALEIDDNDAFVWNCRSNNLLCLLRDEEALENNDRALQLKNNDAETWSNRGNILCNLDRYNEAFECFDNSIKINPDLDVTWYFKGCAYGDLDKWEDAITCFDKALEINHDMYKAYQGKIHALHKLGRHDEAMSKSITAVLMGLAHDDEEMRKTMEAMTGGTKKDLEYYERLIELNPDDAVLWIDKARVLNNLGKYKEAAKCLEQANELAKETGFKRPPVIYAKVTVVLEDAKQFIENHNIESALIEVENFKRGGVLDEDKRQIETIDIVHYFANEIKIELEKKRETPFINFAIAFINKKDDFFKTIININDKMRDKYANMYLLSLLLVDLLYVKDENVAHYTNPEVAKLLLSSNNHFRLNDAKSSNDPMEGKTLLKYLFSEDEKCEISDNDITFIGCFTFDNNHLNQFRLYGKVNKHEATGVSIEVRSEYFEEDETQLITLPEIESLSTSTKKLNNFKKLSLYRCIYLDHDTGVVESVAHIGEVAAKRKKRDYDRSQIENIKSEASKLLEKLKIEVADLDKNKAIPLLENLNALVKFYGYKEEQECRVVKILSDENSKIKTAEIGGHYFIDYLSMNEYVQKITLSPKSADKQEFEKQLRSLHINAKVDVSQHPFRNK